MKLHYKTLWLVLASFFLLTSSVWATPSRQIWIPSVDTQAVGTFNLGLDTYTSSFRKEERTKKRTRAAWAALPTNSRGPDPDSTPNNTNIGLTAGYGFIPEGTLNLELGIDIRESSEDPLFFNAKIAKPEGEWYPAVAVGGYDFGTDQKKTDYNVVYGLLAKTLPGIGRFTAGYYKGNGGVLQDSQGRDQDNGVLLSWDRDMDEISDRLQALIDYQGGDNQYGAFCFGFSWDLTDTATLVAGYQLFNETTLMGRSGMTFQIDIGF